MSLLRASVDPTEASNGRLARFSRIDRSTLDAFPLRYATLCACDLPSAIADPVPGGVVMRFTVEHFRQLEPRLQPFGESRGARKYRAG
jgi:hypothetical protein